MTPAEYNRRQYESDRLTWDQLSDVISHWQADRGLTADGMFGPASEREWERQFAPVFVDPGEPSRIAEFAVQVAIDELGNGEECRNNAGPHLHRYRDFPYGDDFKRPIGEWCAFFAGYCLEQGAARATMELPFDRRFHDDRLNRRMPVGSAKTLGRRVGKAGGFVDVEQVRRGDVMVWDRGRSGSPAGHVGLVESVDRGERLIHTIEGNVGAFPAKVKRRQHDMDRPGRLEFIARV